MNEDSFGPSDVGAKVITFMEQSTLLLINLQAQPAILNPSTIAGGNEFWEALGKVFSLAPRFGGAKNFERQRFLFAGKQETVVPKTHFLLHPSTKLSTPYSLSVYLMRQEICRIKPT